MTTRLITLISCAALLSISLHTPAAKAAAARVSTSEGVYELVPVGRHASGVFDQGSAEILAFDASTRRVFVINANAVTIDVLDITDPSAPVKVGVIDMTAVGGVTNSVAAAKGLVAVAVEANVKQDRGHVAFYDALNLSLIDIKKVGALPDAVTFSKDLRYVLVANEGEPNADYTVDPVGSVSVIDLANGVKASTVRHATFERFNAQAKSLKESGIRIFGPGSSVAQDLEPEFIAATNDGLAYVTLQENNAMAVVDIATATVQSLVPLGYKDHSVSGNELDASHVDGRINLRTWPVLGMYQPDAIASFHVDGQAYLVTANEGDSRDYEGYSEEQRVKALSLDATAFPNGQALQQSEALGSLKISTASGDTDQDGDFDALYAYGARSFSIWDDKASLVFDSGSDFERLTAQFLPEHFNSDDETADSFDQRSDDKGPEPEGVVVGSINDRTLAFIGLERVGGVMVYDVTNPRAPVFQSYLNTRNFDVNVVDESSNSNSRSGDIGPEGMVFISNVDSPTGHPLLVVGNEVSGTTSVFEFHRVWRHD